MKNYIFFVFILICAFLQATLLNSFRIFNVKPDLLLASTVIGALTFRLGWVFVFSLFAGILKDSFSVRAFPINTLLFPLWGYLSLALARKISIESAPVRAGLICAVVIANDIVIRAIYFNLGISIPIGEFLRIVFIESLYTGLALLLCFRIIRPVFNP